ncbi:hypothetical protein DFR31_1578 [Alkalispirillum mobile]|uniref:N-acetyltransferase domain-containing protein n=1 Tax=Alkalispirillum mobile TaxID=85925 RepID=A0A498C5W0_9GAMM|nr:hypothetical protein DFR31_1578 [Alkalispirillum mobile]
MRVRRLLSGLRATFARLGPGTGSLYLLDRAAGGLSRGRARVITYRLFAQPLADSVVMPARLGKNLEIREARPDDPALDLMGRGTTTLQARFNQGARCLVALKGSELAGFFWWVEGPYQEDEVRCVFLPGPPGEAAWDFDVYIHPKYRLSGVFGCLWSAAQEKLMTSGVRYTCSRISAYNTSSLAAHRRLGAQQVGIRVFILFGRFQLTLGDAPPYLHVSRSAARTPRVAVDPLLEANAPDTQPGTGGDR